MELQSLLVLGPGKAYQVRTHLVIIPHPHSLQKTSPLHPTQSRQEAPLKTRVFGAHIRSTICCGLPLSTGEVITPNSGYEGSPALRGLLLYNLHTMADMLLSQQCHRPPLQNSGNSKNCCCVTLSSQPPGAKRAQQFGFP